MTDRTNLTGVLDHMDDKVQGEKATLGDIIEAFGERGYGPLLLAIAILGLLPTGAIPGVPTILAVLVVLIASQLAMGRSSPWIPSKLRKKGFSEAKFKTARQKVRPFTQKIDKAIKPRMEKFTTAGAARAVAGVCVALAITMPPLELVPFASSLPALAIALFGIGLSARDGLIILLGLITAIGAGVGAVYWLAF